MPNELTSEPQLEQAAIPNSQIPGEVHAKDPNYFPTINMALGKSNVALQFKYDAGNKKLYTIKADNWTPTDSRTLRKWEEFKKKYKLSPYEVGEQMKLEENAKFPDGTFRYYISHKTFKRMLGTDGQEYLVRTGWLHGISFMNLEWRYPKNNFDWHYEPVFDTKVGTSGTSYNPVYGDQINSIKVYHTQWDKEMFDKALKDIPYPKNTSIGITFKVGVEGTMGVTGIPSLESFRNKSFNDLYQYARTGDRTLLELTEEEKKAVEAETHKAQIKVRKR